jgi:hypothetical protein
MLVLQAAVETIRNRLVGDPTLKFIERKYGSITSITLVCTRMRSIIHASSFSTSYFSQPSICAAL